MQRSERFLYIRGLVAAAKLGDQQATTTLCREYRGLLHQLAYRYAKRGRSNADYDDYIQVAHIALLKAVERWDEAKAAEAGSASFTTYLQTAVESQLRRHQDLDVLIHVPLYKKDEHGKLPKIPVASLDAPVRNKSSHDEDSAPLLSFTTSDRDTEHEAAQEERSTRLHAALANMKLPSRTRDILRARLLDAETLDEIGQRWGITSERVRQIEQKHRTRALISIKMAFNRTHTSNEMKRALARVVRAKAGGRKRPRKRCTVPVSTLPSGVRVACDRPAMARGMCHSHLARWIRGARGADLECPIGNRKGPRSERAPKTKLTGAQVLAIRAELVGYAALSRAERGQRLRQLAAQYDVTRNTIYRAAKGECWKELTQT